MTSAEYLEVNSERLWNKVSPIVLQESALVIPEERVLALVRKRGPNGLNKREQAFLVLAGIDHLMSCTKGKKNEYPLLRN